MRRDRVAVARSAPASQHRQRDRPVHRAGVEHVQPERVGDPARDGRLPRARRPVDRHDAAPVTRAPVSRREVGRRSRDTRSRPRASPAPSSRPSVACAGDRGRHRDAMVAVALRASHRPAARRGRRARRGRVSTPMPSSVELLLRRVAMRSLSFTGSSAASRIVGDAVGERGRDREHRQLVDDRISSPRDRRCRAAAPRSTVMSPTGSPSASLGHVDLDAWRPSRAARRGTRSGPGSGHVLEHDRSRGRSWRPRRRTRPTTGRRAPRARTHPARPAETRTRAVVDPVDRRAERRQHPLGVVAARARLDDLGRARRPAARRAPARSSPARSPPRARGARRAARRRARKRRERAVGAPVERARPSRAGARRPGASAAGRATRRRSRTDRNGRPGERARPSMRIVVPELPQSMTASGSRRPSTPRRRRPSTPRPPTRDLDAEPLERSAGAGDVVAVGEVRRSALRPSAIAANSSARCEIPLQPGRRSRPRNGAGHRRRRALGGEAHGSDAPRDVVAGSRSAGLERVGPGRRARPARCTPASPSMRVRDLEVGDVDAERGPRAW